MTIHRIFKSDPLGPERIAVLMKAYRITLKKLAMVERDDPLTQMVAKKVLEVGQTGVKDPKDISALALSQLGLD